MASEKPRIWWMAIHGNSVIPVSDLCIQSVFEQTRKTVQQKKKKAVEFCILWSYMETITSWQMQICWQISSWVCVCVCASVRTHMCAVTLEHKENNCHWNVTRFHLTSVLCIGQATSGRRRGSHCQAQALQLKKPSPRGDACEAEN